MSVFKSHRTQEEAVMEREVNGMFPSHTRVNMYRREIHDGGTMYGAILQHHHMRSVTEDRAGWTAQELAKILKDWSMRADGYRDQWTTDQYYERDHQS
jgi:hypothetical protein